MNPELQNALQANWALLLWLILQPTAPWIAGALAGGIVWGASKNHSALVEILRGLLVGVGIGLAVWSIQALAGGTQ